MTTGKSDSWARRLPQMRALIRELGPDRSVFAAVCVTLIVAVKWGTEMSVLAVAACYALFLINSWVGIRVEIARKKISLDEGSAKRSVAKADARTQIASQQELPLERAPRGLRERGGDR